MFSTASATEIESGYIQVDASESSTVTITEDIGFRPDYIEFITAQQIESTDFEESDPTNNDCPDNVNGWSEGSAIFDSSGTTSSDVKKQFSIGAFRNSDSTNGHRVASSTSDVIKNLYTSQDGNLCGTLEVSVKSPTSEGFKVDVEQRYQYDEIIRYKAYQFPDNMQFDAGMVKITSTGSKSVDLGFQPANLHIRAAQQISGKNANSEYWRSPLGRSKGYTTLDNSGSVIDQQSIGTASSSDSTNAHRSIASDEHVLNTVYVDQNANVLGRLRAKVTGADSNGFSMQVDDYYTDDIFLYRAWGFSFYDFKIGYDVIDSRGEKSFKTGFEPDAIDIYAEQQIESINNEVVTPGNSGCDNAGGWSNGFYEADDDRQWAISAGRTSDSQNSHRYASTTAKALNNVYTSQNGGDCGNFEGEVTGTNSSVFNMSFDFDSNFESNYGKEMVYFRAFDFKITPPQVKTVRFENLSTEHAFKVVANVSEGSNDIEECNIKANSSNGNFETYDASVSQINNTWSQCTYNAVSYDDNPQWEDRHDNNDELIKLNVTVNASDIDGRWSEEMETAKFHNNPPTVGNLEFEEYPYSHRFNVTARVYADAYTPNELQGCEVEADDMDGNVYSFEGDIRHSAGGAQVAECVYDNINSSDISDFEPEEDINVTVNLTDQRDLSGWNFSIQEIPNNPPTAYAEEPDNGGIALGEPILLNVTVSDPDSDTLTTWFLNNTDDTVIEVETSPSGQQVTGELPEILVGEDYEWYVKAGDGASNYTTPVYSFTKAVSQSFRVSTNIQYRYSDLITTPGSNKDIFFEVSNRVPGEKSLITYLEGDVEATFSDGSKKTSYTVPGKSKREFIITVNPESTGDKELKIVTKNENLDINTSTSIEVKSRDFITNTGVELPGVSLLHLIVLSFAGVTTYYLQL